MTHRPDRVQRSPRRRRGVAALLATALLAGLVSFVGFGTATAGAVIDPPALIDNGTVQLGVNPGGQLNVPGPSSSGGTPYVGLRYLPTNAESTAPGCLCEGWGAADATSGINGYANQNQGGLINVEVASFESTPSTAVSVANVMDGATPFLQVTHNYRPSGTPNLYEVEVTIKNVSGGTVDPRYRRVMDWDVEPTAFSEFSTIQGTATATNVLFASDDGFASGNPLSGPTSIDFTGDAVDSGPNDHGALFDFGFDPLSPGEDVTFLTYYGAAGTETEAEAALGAVGAEIYSFGQANTPDGPTLGTPNTFIFAFAGVGGAPIIPAVRLTNDAVSVGEAAGTATIGVELTSPADTAVTVNYEVGPGGTATSGTDYVGGTGTVTIPKGATTTSFPVSIIDDLVDEADETVAITLSAPTGAVLGLPSSGVLTIVDDDDPSTVNQPPVVDSGPEKSGLAGTDVVLAGSAVDPDNGPVSPLDISWILSVLGPGDKSSCTFTGTDTVTPTLNCTVPGNYLVQIGAFDGEAFVDDTGTKVTFTEPVPSDVTAPVCELVSATSTGITVRAVDPDSGLATIDVTRAKNANVNVPTFTTGTNDEQIVTATKIKAGSSSNVQLRVTDEAGNSTVCDPVIAKLTAGEARTFHGVPDAEHYLTVSEAAGVAGVAVEVNGTSQIIWSPDGTTVDLGDMGDGTVTLRVLATEGTTAQIMLWDGKG